MRFDKLQWKPMLRWKRSHELLLSYIYLPLLQVQALPRFNLNCSNIYHLFYRLIREYNISNQINCDISLCFRWLIIILMMQQVQVKIENSVEDRADQNPIDHSHVPKDDPCAYKNNKTKCFEKWSIQENLTYVEFLKEYEEQLKSQFHRRSSRIFSQMAKYVKTRNSEQCRTHHQKMIYQSHTIERIIEKIEQKKSRMETPKILKKRGRKPKLPMIFGENDNPQNSKPARPKTGIPLSMENLQAYYPTSSTAIILIEWQKIDII